MANRIKNEVNEYYFPIEMLRGMLDNPNKVMQDIFRYGILAYAEAHGADEDEVQGVFGCKLGKPLREQRKGMKQYDKKQPFTHIGRARFWSMQDKANPSIRSEFPTETEIIVLLAELGLKSIMGKANEREHQTTIARLFARMHGYADEAHQEEHDPRIDKWQTRRAWARLKALLEDVTDIHFKTGCQRGVKFKKKPKPQPVPEPTPKPYSREDWQKYF